LLGTSCEAHSARVALAILFGMLWGLGNLTFGLSVRYLGMALGYAIALGFCMVAGTLVPPIYDGLFGSEADRQKLAELFTTAGGWIVLGSVAVCLLGIAICGLAGMAKESELPLDQKQETVKEFNFRKGFSVAVFSGLLSACFAFGLAAGKPIAKVSQAHGTTDIFQNNAVLVVILVGGLLSNGIWCLVLNQRNRSFRDYVTGPRSQQLSNYALAASGGVIWYFQFFFYGMGETKLGDEYRFSSWAIHMAFIIVFSNLWGLVFQEWRGTSRRTRALVWLGILILIGSTVVNAAGRYVETKL